MSPDVLVLTYQLFPDPSHVHRGSFVVEQIEELSELCKMAVIAPVSTPLPRKKFKTERDYKSLIPKRGRVGNAELYRPRFLDLPRLSKQLNDFSMLLSILRCVLRNRIRVDVIHCHYAYPAGYVGAHLGRLLRKPVVLTVHGSDVHTYTQDSFPHPLTRTRVLHALKDADLVVAVSQALKSRVEQLGFPGKKAVVIPCGYTSAQFRPISQEEMRRELGFPTRGRMVLFVGNLVEVKGVAFLVRAMARLVEEFKDVFLVIAGDGELRKPLEDEVRQLGLAERASFVGSKPHGQVASYMNACDLLVLPSLNEGFGIVLAEAMACGKPVVASRVGGIPEIVSSSEVGILVDPEDPDKLAGAIQVALRRTWDPARLAAHANQFSSEGYCRRIRELYNGLSMGRSRVRLADRVPN